MPAGAPMFTQNPMHQQQQQFANNVRVWYKVNGTWQAYKMGNTPQTVNENVLEKNL